MSETTVVVKTQTVELRLANTGTAGHAAAPADLRLWLDRPGARFAFQEVPITGAGSKRTVELSVPAAGKPFVPWCVWSIGGQALSVPDMSSSALRGLTRVVGFGTPLPTRIEGAGASKQLVLPNSLRLTVAGFDFTNRQRDALLDAYEDFARSYFRDTLRIQLDVTRAKPPGLGTSWIFMRVFGSSLTHDPNDPDTSKVFVPVSKRGLEEGRDFRNTIGAVDLAAPPFTLPDPAHSVMVVYVEQLAGYSNPRTRAEAQLMHTRIYDVGEHYDMGHVFGLPPCPLIAQGVRVHNPLDLAHELGHVLEGDVGVGRLRIEHHHPLGLRPQRMRTIQAYLERLGVNDPTVGETGKQVYERELFDAFHAPAQLGPNPNRTLTTNLMRPTGGAQPHDLLPWQVAVIRDDPRLQP